MTSAASSATGTGANESAIRRLLRATEVDTRMIGMIAALGLIWIGFHLYTLIASGEGLFLTPRNLWNLSVQTSSIAVMATGMVLIIVMRYIDLSVGSIVGFVSTIVGVAQVRLLPVYLGLDNPAIWVIAVLLALAVGAAIGAFQGSLVAYLGIPSFIVTLGRTIVLARRGVVGDDRPDDRAPRRPLRAHGRGPARLDRSQGELGLGRNLLRGHRLRPLCGPSAPRAVPAPRSGRFGRNM